MNQYMLWIFYYWNEMIKRIRDKYKGLDKDLDKESRRCIYGVAILFSGVLGFNFIKYTHLKKLYSSLIYPLLAVPSELNYPLRII